MSNPQPPRALKSILFGLCLSGTLLLPLGAKAQQAGTTQLNPAIEPRNAVTVILMSGLVGGVLGLSTLSFYSRPQDNIRNITIGAGVGMIASAIFMTYTVSQTAVPQKTAQFQWAPTAGPSEWGLAAQLHF